MVIPYREYQLDWDWHWNIYITYITIKNSDKFCIKTWDWTNKIPPNFLRWLKKDRAGNGLQWDRTRVPKTLDSNKSLSLHFFTHWGGSLEKYSTTFLNIPHIHAKPQPLVSTSWSLNQPTCQPLQWLSTTGFKIVTVLQLSTTGCYNASYHIHSIPDKKNPHHDHPMYFYTEGRKVKTQFHGCDLVYASKFHIISHTLSRLKREE